MSAHRMKNIGGVAGVALICIGVFFAGFVLAWMVKP